MRWLKAACAGSLADPGSAIACWSVALPFRYCIQRSYWRTSSMLVCGAAPLLLGAKKFEAYFWRSWSSLSSTWLALLGV